MHNLNLFLAILGAILGLVATGGIIYAVWLMAQHRDVASNEHTINERTINERTMPFPATLLKWTVLDYIVMILFIFGLLLLFVDLLAVLRDRASFQEWHLIYLAAGVIFSFMGMIMMFLRLFMFHNAVRSLSRLAPDHQNEPNDGDKSE